MAGPCESLTTPDFLRDVAQRHAEREAIAFEGVALSYAEFEAGVREVARGLVAAGVAKGSRVGVLMGNRPEWLISFFAIGSLGAVAVGINTFATASERSWLLRHADVAVLLLQPQLLKHRYLDDLLRDHPLLGQEAPGALRDSSLPQLRRIVSLGEATRPCVESWDAFLAAGSSVPETLLDALAHEVHPSDDALLIYTSGTTENPKGAVHLQRTPCIQARNWAQQLRRESRERVWSPLPLFWSAGLSMVAGSTLHAGACLVLQETFDPAEALELLERERVTTVHVWPHAASQIAALPDARTRDLSALEKVASSSALHPLAGLEGDRWDPAASYGMSETMTISCAIPADAPAGQRANSHGRPLPGMQLCSVDPISGAILRAGEPGEIAVKGPTLMRGYHKQPPEACFDERGFFRTGDAGSIDADGFLHFTGRLTGIVKTAGANVSPVEVEETLRRWGRLRSVHILGVPHPTLGEALVLCAVRHAGQPVTESEVIEQLRGSLAAYKVPQRVLFFEMDELPLTGSQKARLDELRALAAQRLEHDEGGGEWGAWLRERRVSSVG
jgi:fatty-acyl-CoA synthase